MARNLAASCTVSSHSSDIFSISPFEREACPSCFLPKRLLFGEARKYLKAVRMPEDPLFALILNLCKQQINNVLYDSRLTQVEIKGGKIARKTACGVKKWVQQESEKQMLLVRLLILAGILGQPGERNPTHIFEFNRLIPQVLLNLRSIKEKRHLAETLETMAVIGCHHCLRIPDRGAFPGLYCSKKCHKAALDRSAYLARQARDRKIRSSLPRTKLQTQALE